MRLAQRLRRNKASGAAGEKDQSSVTPTGSQRRLLTPFSSSGPPTGSHLVKREPSTSLTTSTQTASSKELQPQLEAIIQPQVEAKISEAEVRGVPSVDNVNDHEDCVLFHDDSNSNNHDDDDENDEKGNGRRPDGADNDNLSVNLNQLLKAPGLIAPATPDSRRHNGNLTTGPPNNLILPPREVTIDPNAVPPSPMRDPSVVFTAMQEDQGRILNLGNQQQQQQDQHQYRSEDLYQLQTPEVLGDPVGDIAMKRQLLDAHRLVRVILGKKVSTAGDAPLETSTILHAIRSYALMKQELIDLRKRQEVAECDPPSILQTLGSPDTSATTTNCSTTPRSVTSASPSPRLNSFAVGWKIQQPIPEQTCVMSDSSSTAVQLLQAKSQIEILEQQLSVANETISTLQSENTKYRQEAADRESTIRIQTPSHGDLDVKYDRLVENYTESVEEAKRNLDLVLEEVASVPRRVLAKDSVREKLKVYVQTVSQLTSQLEQAELCSQFHKSQEESRGRIQALEEQLLQQEETHRQQLATLKGTCGSHETIKVTSPTSIASLKDGEEDNDSVAYRMRVLKTRLLESQVEADTLIQQIQDLQICQRAENGDAGQAESSEFVQQDNLILKEVSQNRTSRISTTSTTHKLEVEDEKKIED